MLSRVEKADDTFTLRKGMLLHFGTLSTAIIYNPNLIPYSNLINASMILGGFFLVLHTIVLHTRGKEAGRVLHLPPITI